MNLRERIIVGILIYIAWLILLLVPFIPVASGQTNMNYNYVCSNYPDDQCQPCCHGYYIVYSNPNGTGTGTIIYPSECNLLDAVCEKWTIYGSAVNAIIPFAGNQHIVGPYYVAGLFYGFGAMIMGFFDFLFIVIPLGILIWKIRGKTLKNYPSQDYHNNSQMS